MNVYDYCFLLWLIFAGILGFRQGLSVIIVRYVISAAGFLIFPYLYEPVEKLWISTIGHEWSWFATVAILAVLFVSIMETAVYLFSEVREGLMLTLPDRLLGMVVSLAIGLVMAVVITIVLVETSYSVSQSFKKSFTHSLLDG